MVIWEHQKLMTLYRLIDWLNMRFDLNIEKKIKILVI